MLEEKIQESIDLHENILKYSHTKLKIRLIVYFLVAVLMLSIVTYDILENYVPLNYSVLGIAIGVVIGFIVSRMFKITWDKKAQKVISNLDTLGIIILCSYIILEIYRKQLVEYFVGEDLVLRITFAVIAGIMIGRVLGIRRKVRKLLEKHL